MTELADGEARRRIATEFGATFFVEAAAGTGKTTALVRRIVGLISAGIGTLDRIVAVTFTEKAAGETKLNLRTEIEAARANAGPEQRARLDRALEELELARIGTIHAFCGDLLHERPRRGRHLGYGVAAAVRHEEVAPDHRRRCGGIEVVVERGLAVPGMNSPIAPNISSSPVTVTNRSGRGKIGGTIRIRSRRLLPQ